MDSKESRVASNEEIVDEITRGLEETCLQRDETKSTSQIVEEQDEKFYDVNDGSQNDSDEHTEFHDSLEEHKPDLQVSDVDEVALKDRELNLSEEEKQSLRRDAEDLKNEGNTLFKSASYREAVTVYTQGIQTCPLAFDKDRAILFANRAAAKSKCDERTSAIDDCSKAIELDPTYLRAILRRAQLYEQEDKLDEALADFQRVLEIEPAHWEARDAARRLPPKINERNEKLKEEMLGKLKDLGNMFLKPFGLSTNNFAMEQDPSTGGYSVKFNQNRS